MGTSRKNLHAYPQAVYANLAKLMGDQRFPSAAYYMELSDEVVFGATSPCTENLPEQRVPSDFVSMCGPAEPAAAALSAEAFASAADEVAAMKVADLKEALEGYGLETVGKKAVLAERLLARMLHRRRPPARGAGAQPHRGCHYREWLRHETAITEKHDQTVGS